MRSLKLSVLAKNSGRVEAVQDQAGDQRRVRVALGVVVALEVLDAAEHGIVRAPGAADEVEQAQGDRDPDAPQHAEHGDAGERGHRQRELGPPPVVQAPRGAQVEQAEHGDDDDGGQRAERHVVDEAGAGEQQHAEGNRAGEAGELAAGAHVLHDGGARAAGGDGKPWKTPAARLAAPSAASSWFWSTRWCSRAA